MLRTLQRLFYFVNLRMQKNSIFIFCLSLLFVGSCNNKTDQAIIQEDSKAEVEKSPAIFSITEFLKGQLHDLEEMPITPILITKANDRIDSVWRKRENIRAFAKPFLSPVIDSVSMHEYFNSKSFFDQTIDAITIMYDANEKLPKDIVLTHFDVYINPESGKVKRIYMLKKPSPDSTIQLTWTVDKWCSIVTIVQSPGKKATIKEEKMDWSF